MGVIELTNDEQFGNIQMEVDSNALYVAYFSATWCGPCKEIAPIIEKLSNIYTKWKFYKLNIDNFEDTSNIYGVESLPTFIFFKGTYDIDRVEKADAKAVEAILKKYSQ